MTIAEELLANISAEQLKRTQIEALGKRKTEPNLKGVADAYSEYFFWGMLNNYCAYLSYTQIKRPDALAYQRSDFIMLPAVIEALDAGKYKHPAIHIYNKIRLLYEGLSKENNQFEGLYLEIYNLIKKEEKKRLIEEIIEMYSFLSNFCIKKANAGILIYRERLFFLYNDVINLKYSRKKSKKDLLPATLFKNMVALATALNKNALFNGIATVGLKPSQVKGFRDGRDWAIHFIKYYHKKLDETDRPIYYAYTNTFVAFHQGKYKAAFFHLGNPNYVQRVTFNYDIKKLQLMVLYEVNHHFPDFLETQGVAIRKVLEAFRGLIRDEEKRKKQLRYQLTFYKVFESLYRSLFLWYEKYHTTYNNAGNNQFLQKKTKLLETINSKANKYAYKAWFLEKVNAVK